MDGSWIHSEYVYQYINWRDNKIHLINRRPSAISVKTIHRQFNWWFRSRWATSIAFSFPIIKTINFSIRIKLLCVCVCACVNVEYDSKVRAFSEIKIKNFSKKFESHKKSSWYCCWPLSSNGWLAWMIHRIQSRQLEFDRFSLYQRIHTVYGHSDHEVKGIHHVTSSFISFTFFFSSIFSILFAISSGYFL